MKRIVLALLALACASLFSGAADAACPSFPFVAGKCIEAGELNSAFAMSRGITPPNNGEGNSTSGAPHGSLWLDTSTTPYTLRECKTAPNCSTPYNSSQWARWGKVNSSTEVFWPNSLTGDAGGLFYTYPSLAWDLSHGTSAAPITAAGPSLRVSRTENIANATCSVFNNNECNAAGYFFVQNIASGSTTPMQINAVFGGALTYSEYDLGVAVGVQGIARAVGSSTAGVAGGYFEGRYDSTAVRNYYYTIGAEARTNNLSGLDATPDTAGGNSFNGLLSTCGDGTPRGDPGGAWNCNAGLAVVANASQFAYGVVIASSDGGVNPAAAYQAGFADYSDSSNALIIRGTHDYQINGEKFFVTGTGNFSYAASGDPATFVHHLTVLSPDENQARFASTGSNHAVVAIENTTTALQASIRLLNAGTIKWQVGKSAANDFFVFDQAASANAITATTNAGGLILGTAQNVSINGSTGAVTVGQLAGIGQRSVCVSAAGLLVAGAPGC